MHARRQLLALRDAGVESMFVPAMIARAVPVGLTVLCLVALLADFAHLARLAPEAGTSFPPGREWYSEHLAEFDRYPGTTWLHLVLAALLVALIPIQFSSALRRRSPAVHRWIGRIFTGVSVCIAVSGVVLGIAIPFGGRGESVIIAAMGILFVVAIARGVQSARDRHFARHRAWMIRATAIGLSIASMRIINGLLFALRIISDRDLFSVSLLLGLVVNLVFAEAYIRRAS